MSKIRFIDIIRVLGLMLVLTYHLFKDALPGGFLGVDIFFTFSGYLITSLIISTFTKEGNFSFVPYMKRRFSRIFPTLFFSLLFTLPFVRLLPNDFTASIDKQITAVLGFVTNYFEILSGGSYEARLLPHLYIHTWSLAIEFHYYIIWGCLATLFSFIFSRSINKNKLFKLSLLLSSIILSVLSYFNMQRLFLSNSNLSVAYFATTSHIYSFFIGSILGILFGLKLSDGISKKLKDSSTLFKILSITIIPIIVIAIFILCRKTNFESSFTYNYGFLIMSFLTFILILLTRILHEVIPEKFKDSILINHIATISYAMYLFHWPFYIIFSNIIIPNSISALCTIVCSYIFSIFTIYTIEPIFYKSRYSTKVHSLRKNILVTCLLSAICLYFAYNTIVNRQIISTLQEEQMVGNVIQNIDKIEHLEQSIKNIHDDPLLQNNLNNDEQSQPLDKNPDISHVSPQSDKIPNNDSLPQSDNLPNNDSLPQSDNLPNNDSLPQSDNLPNNASLPQSDNLPNNASLPQSDNLPNNDSLPQSDNLPNNDSLPQSDNLPNNASLPQSDNLPNNASSPQSNNLNMDTTVTIIGDSVTLGARKQLLETIPNSYVDAKVSRNLKAGYDIFKELQETDTLGQYVVIALGTNGIPAFATYIQKFIDELPSGHRLIFVTPYDGRWTNTWNSYKTTQYLRNIKDKYDFVTIADWATIVSNDPSIVGADKIHIGGYKKGIQAFVSNISSAIDIATNKGTK